VCNNRIGRESTTAAKTKASGSVFAACECQSEASAELSLGRESTDITAQIEYEARVT
jgi:hypothetical protein